MRRQGTPLFPHRVDANLGQETLKKLMTQRQATWVFAAQATSELAAVDIESSVRMSARILLGQWGFLFQAIEELRGQSSCGSRSGATNQKPDPFKSSYFQ